MNDFDENEALAELLRENIIFPVDKETDDYKTIALYVLTSDIFAWGCADKEEITLGALPKLYEFYKKNGSYYGVVKWACFQRAEQPQDPIKEDMIKNGQWDDKLEKLRKNKYWELLKNN